MEKRRVYHFCSAEHGISNLQLSRLKVATFPDLNDPFELMCHRGDEIETRQFAKNISSFLSARYGLICFSRNYSNPVQWAHYGQSHQGICLGFDIEKAKLQRVKYSGSRLVLRRTEQMTFNYLDPVMRAILLTKFKHWSYEQEERVIVDLDKDMERDGLYFCAMDGIFELKEVIVGCKSKISRAQIDEALLHHNVAIDRFSVRPAFNSYKIVRQNDSDLWK